MQFKTMRNICIPTLLFITAVAGAEVRDISTQTLSFVHEYETLTGLTYYSATGNPVASWNPDTTHNAIQVTYSPVSGDGYPALKHVYGTGQDWSGASGIAVEAYNPNSITKKVNINVYSPAGNLGTQYSLPPGASTLVLQFSGVTPSPNAYGMTSLPPLYFGANLATRSSYSISGTFTPTSIIEVRLSMPPGEVTSNVNMRFDSLRLLKPMSISDWLSNIVDKYGQFTGRSYTGKATTNSDLTSQYSSEHSALTLASPPSGLSAYLGNTSYTTTASGWFKTYKDTSNKWWLVDPLGNYFYSVGANSILGKRHGATMTSQGIRPSMFLDLPAKTDTYYGSFYNLTDNTGSLTGYTSGESYSHYLANIFTKYGGGASLSWNSILPLYRAEADLRMKIWGMNTVGAWSGQENDAREWFHKSTTPYTIAIGSTTSENPVNKVQVPGRTAVPDPYDANFAPGVLKRVTWAANTKDSNLPTAKKVKEDKYFIGYFIDNELGWRSGATETASPSGGPHALALAVFNQVGTPAKNALISRLQSKYASIGDLNTAWSTPTYTTTYTWADLQGGLTITASNVTPGMAVDFKEYIGDFATQYFSKVKAAVVAADSNHLYLGCRFATPPASAWNFTDEVLTAAGAYCDVVSFNVYGPPPSTTLTSKFALCNKPVLISETSVQAQDQDHFSDILVPSVDTQTQRSVTARTLMDAYGADQNIVGFHWFCWADQAVAGIPWEGENFNTGLVSITDRPYAGLISEISSFSAGIYAQRSTGPSPFSPQIPATEKAKMKANPKMKAAAKASARSKRR